MGILWKFARVGIRRLSVCHAWRLESGSVLSGMGVLRSGKGSALQRCKIFGGIKILKGSYAICHHRLKCRVCGGFLTDNGKCMKCRMSKLKESLSAISKGSVIKKGDEKL